MQAQDITRKAGITALNKWVAEVGITPITAWRYRRNGWLQTLNICGRQYITDEAVEEFLKRASAGEFAKEHKAPGRKAIQLQS